MAVRPLPPRANLDHLRNESREFQRLVRGGDADALADLREFHHKRAHAAQQLVLTDAQHVVARRYGFASWTALKRFVDEVDRYTRMPHEVPLDDGDLPTRFLLLACLNYGGDDRARHAEARQLLSDHPEVATADIFTMAAAGEVDAARAVLTQDPAAANREGGPHRWPPLLYAAYSRAEPTTEERSTLAVARLLLDAGADPNAGTLWDGQYPFTALTGAFGGGEDHTNQPRHHDDLAFARLLLDAGADPNDTQAIYNRMFWPDNSHLELLFEYGLGRSDVGPWARRLGTLATPIDRALALDLQWSAEHNYVDRVRFLLDHGVPADADSCHAALNGRSAHELAVRAGNQEIADLLEGAGAGPTDLDAVGEFTAACLRGDRATATALLAANPTLMRTAEERDYPLHRAVELGRRGAVELMLELGFDVNARADLHRTTPLHEAAAVGDRALAEVLIGMGADPSIRDQSFNANALGWAIHHGRDDVAAHLQPLTPE